VPENPRIAIVSDPLVQRGGAERVVECLAEAFPDAPIFALLYSAELGPAKIAGRVTPSWLARVPFLTEHHRPFFPLYRNAIEAFDVSAYDVIISSHHTVAKSVLTKADQVHISYCHTPMRAIWERNFEELATVPQPARAVVSALFSNLRVYDVACASRVQHYLANSTSTQRRIATFYRRESEIVFPPIETEFFTPGDGDAGDYYLVASRPVPYKRVDIAIDACAKLGRRLVIVGGLHTMKKIPPHVEALGRVSDEKLRDLMRGARALLFPQYEDFGMTPLEVNACGRPVVAYGAGGALDTIVDGLNGVVSAEQTVPSFIEAIERFEKLEFDPNRIRAHALGFSRDRFEQRVKEIVATAWENRSQVLIGR
jgi:glycosyltransferase involved in cell wall biosynthesis